MDLKSLKPNPKNPRTISNEKLEMLKKALNEFGDLGGIVFNRKTKQLVGGHQRKKLIDSSATVHITKTYEKPTKVGTRAIGYIDHNGERFSYREVEWDEVKEKAANIAANKGAGEWDLPELSSWLRDLEDFGFDLDLTMFDETERLRAMAEVISTPAQDEKEDAIPATPKTPKTKKGDIYRLGAHRLLCGDSTSADDIGALIGPAKCKITFTSPPYNLGTNAKLRGKNASGKDTVYKEYNDAQSQGEYLSFLGAFTKAAIDVSDYVFCNIQMLAGNKLIFPDYWSAFKNHLVDIMVWDKEYGAPAMAPNCLNSAFEFIFIFSNEEEPSRAIRSGDEFRGNTPNIFRLNPVREGKDPLAKEHGAVFPVKFPEYFVNKFTKAKDLVFDPFGGSGTTMIACEKLNRKCVMMELDPIYCDVIVARWEAYTGKKAELIKKPAKQEKHK